MTRRPNSFLFLAQLTLVATFFAYVPAYAENANNKELETYAKSPTLTQKTILFTPPKGWKPVEASALSPAVKAMVVGNGEHEYPPSINLATEEYSGTLKEYLKIIKSINQAQGTEWKDLGIIRTEAGSANLSQVDSKTEWGDVRMMHVILLKDGTVYILTATSLKEEFPKFYRDFFSSMSSLRFQK